MSDVGRGTDRTGRRQKRFLSPSERCKVWLQLVRQQVTIAEAAVAHHVDGSTIMRIRWNEVVRFSSKGQGTDRGLD